MNMLLIYSCLKRKFGIISSKCSHNELVKDILCNLLPVSEMIDSATWAYKKHLKGQQSYFMCVCVSFLICCLEYSSVIDIDPNSNPEPSANVVVVACTRVLLLNDPPHLDPELLSHYCDPISNSQVD